VRKTAIAAACVGRRAGVARVEGCACHAQLCSAREESYVGSGVKSSDSTFADFGTGEIGINKIECPGHWAHLNFLLANTSAQPPSPDLLAINREQI
jgi:hypothetical protein